MTAIVVGGGIMGLSAARALLQRGLRVTVYEQGAVPNPAGSSVDRHRLIRFPYDDHTGYTRMVGEAYPAWERLWSDLGVRLYHPTGTLVLDRHPEGWGRRSADTLTALGHPVHVLSPGDLAARYPYVRPDGLSLVFEVETGGVLLADAIVAHLAAYVRRRGGVLHTGVAVSEVDPSRPAVTRAGGHVETADVVVVAAGPWVGRLLPGAAGRVTPSHQIVAYLDPPAAFRDAWRRAPMLLDIGDDAGFYLVPPAGGTALKIGDHRFTLKGDPDAPRTPDPASVRNLIELARPRLHTFDAYRLTEARTCFYTVAPDEAFIVEPIERAWLLAGFSGHGFKFGPLVGERLAATVADGLPAAKLTAWAAGRATGPAPPIAPPPA